MDYLLHIIVLVGVYSILAGSLDLLVGQTGLLSLAHAGFWGLGAYSSALLTVRVGASIFAGIIVGMACSAVFAVLLALPSLRLRDDYFVIVTFGAQLILFSAWSNLVPLTGGPLGIAGIPQPSLMGRMVGSHLEFAVFAWLLAAISMLVVRRLSESPLGRVLRAIREDEGLARAVGKNSLRFKVTVFWVSAVLAASAGSLYAHYITYIDPGSFSVAESMVIISMVIIGGSASRWGPVVGAAILVVLPELLRFLGLPSSVAANVRQILYGILLVVMMTVRPRGLVGRYGFWR